MWLTNILFSKNIVVIPEDKPLSPLWSTVLSQVWLKLNTTCNLVYDEFFNIYGLEVGLCVVAAVFVFWKAEQHRFKDIDELLQLKRTQVVMEPNTWGMKKIRKNSEAQMEHAISLLKNTHSQLDEMLAYIKKKRACNECKKQVEESLQNNKERETEKCADWLKDTYRKNYGEDVKF